jgi:geranylgeranyl diphosphate synthase type II
MAHSPLQSTAYRTVIETYLEGLLHRRVQSAHDMSPRYEALWQEIVRVSRYGKRLRPLMVFQAYESFGGQEITQIVPAAAACELLHVSMLIHDDIIDRDTLRHGQATIEGAYRSTYAAEVTSPRDQSHNALSAALLAGDLLLNEARSLITKCEVDPDRLQRAGHAFDQAVFEVAGGELLDIESVHAPRGSIDPLSIMAYKTASYSFVGPLSIGAILAGAPLNAQNTIRSFALNLGIAYQLTDDIIGVFGNSNVTGKPNDGDISEGKATALVQQFYTLAKPDKIEQLETYYGQRGITADQVSLIRDLLKTSGALHETELLIKTYVTRARRDLAALELAPEHFSRFEELISVCTERSS